MAVSAKHASIAALGLAAFLALGACAGADEDEATERGRVTDDSGASAPLRVEAHEFSLSPEGLRAAPGSVAIEYVNKGAILHTLVVEGVKGLKLEVPGPGDVDTGSVKLEPGRYILFCDVPGHRQAGMEAPLAVG
jgi:plastocyanin